MPRTLRYLLVAMLSSALLTGWAACAVTRGLARAGAVAPRVAVGTPVTSGAAMTAITQARGNLLRAGTTAYVGGRGAPSAVVIHGANYTLARRASSVDLIDHAGARVAYSQRRHHVVTHFSAEDKRQLGYSVVSRDGRRVKHYETRRQGGDPEFRGHDDVYPTVIKHYDEHGNHLFDTPTGTRNLVPEIVAIVGAGALVAATDQDQDYASTDNADQARFEERLVAASTHRADERGSASMPQSEVEQHGEGYVATLIGAEHDRFRNALMIRVRYTNTDSVEHCLGRSRLTPSSLMTSSGDHVTVTSTPGMRQVLQTDQPHKACYNYGQNRCPRDADEYTSNADFVIVPPGASQPLVHVFEGVSLGDGGVVDLSLNLLRGHRTPSERRNAWNDNGGCRRDRHTIPSTVIVFNEVQPDRFAASSNPTGSPRSTPSPRRESRPRSDPFSAKRGAGGRHKLEIRSFVACDLAVYIDGRRVGEVQADRTARFPIDAGAQAIRVCAGPWSGCEAPAIPLRRNSDGTPRSLNVRGAGFCR